MLAIETGRLTKSVVPKTAARPESGVFINNFWRDHVAFEETSFTKVVGNY
jgi:hypothetical protein